MPKRPTKRPPQRPIQRGPLHRINEHIRVPSVRLVGTGEANLDGVYATERALELAKQMELDLVEVASAADPPVVRIVEYSKFLYDLKKKEKEAKAKQHKVIVKEVRFGPNTDDHDFNFKLKHARKFLEEGFKVKAYIHFHGRTIVHRERSAGLLDKFSEDLQDVSKMEMAPQMEGKRLYMILAPKK